MQNLTPIFFNDDDDENGNYDDVDQLFSHLESFEPPADMVARIMNVVSQLPSPLELQSKRQRSSLASDGLVVDETDREPS